MRVLATAERKDGINMNECVFWMSIIVGSINFLCYVTTPRFNSSRDPHDCITAGLFFLLALCFK